MKKIIAILLILTLTLVFASCGNNGKNDTDSVVNTDSIVDSEVTADTNTDTNADSEVTADTNTDTNVDSDNDYDEDKVTVSLSSTKSEISVNEKITVKITVSNAPNVKSAGFIVNFDSDLFTFVSGEFLVNGEVVEFKEGTGVIAFNTPTDVNKEVASFTLKAISQATLEDITVKSSLIDADDKPIEIQKNKSITVTIK